MKKCTLCKNEFEANLDNFYKEPRVKTGLSSRCKACHAKKTPTIIVSPGRKICNSCNKEKELEYFGNDKHRKDGKLGTCKECRNVRQAALAESKVYNYNKRVLKECKSCKEYKKANLTHFHQHKGAKDGLKGVCKECKKKARPNYSQKYGEYRICKVCSKQKPRTEKFFPRQHRNSENLSYVCRSCKNNKARERYRNWSSQEKMVENCRKRTRDLVKGKDRSITSLQLLGYSDKEWHSKKEFCLFINNYIEELFSPDMTWNNYGDWHIDHIVPCSVFDLSKPDHLSACFHYTNLQPLWATDNLAKSDTIPQDGISELIQQLNILEN